MGMSLIGAAIKSRREEELLAAEFGEAWTVYASDVPPWIPRLTRRDKEVSHVSAAAP